MLGPIGIPRGLFDGDVGVRNAAVVEMEHQVAILGQYRGIVGRGASRVSREVLVGAAEMIKADITCPLDHSPKQRLCRSGPRCRIFW